MSDATMLLWEIISLVKVNGKWPSRKLVDGAQKQKNIPLFWACFTLTSWLNQS
jgi:hypothetical protein